jgi:peptidoglycan/LPS O-acetylase OafA/YrhL
LVLTTAALPMSLAMFAAVATSQRYTADFLPFLVCAAALGTALIEDARPSLRTWGRALTALVTGAAILITLSLTLRNQGEQLWDVPNNVARDYRALGKTVDGLLGIRHQSAEEATR